MDQKAAHQTGILSRKTHSEKKKAREVDQHDASPDQAGSEGVIWVITDRQARTNTII